MNNNSHTKISQEILQLHAKYFIPQQYTPKEIIRKKPIPTLRIYTEDGDVDFKYFVDVIIINQNSNSRTPVHEFIDCAFYEGDYVGMGNTIEEALKNLLKLTKKSIRCFERNIK